MNEYRVLLEQSFVVTGNSTDEARANALTDLKDLLRDGWFRPSDVTIIEQVK